MCGRTATWNAFLLCAEIAGWRTLSYPGVMPTLLRYLVDLNFKTGIQSMLIVCGDLFITHCVHISCILLKQLISMVLHDPLPYLNACFLISWCWTLIGGFHVPDSRMVDLQFWLAGKCPTKIHACSINLYKSDANGVLLDICALVTSDWFCGFSSWNCSKPSSTRERLTYEGKCRP